jgi:hypothetical protein
VGGHRYPPGSIPLEGNMKGGIQEIDPLLPSLAYYMVFFKDLTCIPEYSIIGDYFGLKILYI